VNDYVDFGNNASLSMGTGDATVSLWAKFDNATAPQRETLVDCWSTTAGNPGYLLVRDNGTSKLHVWFCDGSATTPESDLSASGSLGSATWYNIVLVFSRSSVAQAYINGIKQSSSLNISGYPGNVQNSYSLRVGALDSSTWRFAGKMDEVRLYNAAMPISQIKEQYYASLNKLFAEGGISKEEYLSRINETGNSMAEAR